ncbi:MAG TPA: YggS family pyridoxal phosphate-dependent enzyme [Anaeromyxobacteraceae bacterium]|nr:YggS family pyridoxal phosphate-dependent enzyme [Anaeromyxobacteraceae bacterium]
MTVAERLARLRAVIPPGVTLLAVSKAQPAEAVREAYAAGQRHFGENYVQEWRDKAEALSDLPGLAWHFVGSLQTNKVKYLVGRVALVHTVDRLELAREISRRSSQRGVATAVLLEVNVAGEASKSGCPPAEVPALAEAVRALPGLDLRGLMCIPPAEGDPRPHFRTLRGLRDRLGLAELSMGMSGDYLAAIEEGATVVRVGTAIFGERPPRRASP